MDAVAHVTEKDVEQVMPIQRTREMSLEMLNMTWAMWVRESSPNRPGAQAQHEVNIAGI